MYFHAPVDYNTFFGGCLSWGCRSSVVSATALGSQSVPVPLRISKSPTRLCSTGLMNCQVTCHRIPCGRIVDLGANVGYSCLWWANLCPNAEIEAFEPHPIHAELLRWHIRKNGL